MFFENEYLSFRILDVVALDQKNVHCRMTGRNFDSISYRLSSNATLTVGESTHRVREGAVAFVPARLSYARRADRDHLIAIHLDMQNYTARDIEVCYPQDPREIASLFEEIYTLWQGKRPGYLYECAALCHRILGVCHRENSKENATRSPISASVAYLQEHFADPDLTVAAVAAKSFMSEVYFRRLFKRAFGTSPAKYLIELRIRHAVGLMSAGYHSLGEIAALCGYTDYAYFSAEFKRIKGVPPTAYSYNFRMPKA